MFSLGNATTPLPCEKRANLIQLAFRRLSAADRKERKDYSEKRSFGGFCLGTTQRVRMQCGPSRAACEELEVPDTREGLRHAAHLRVSVLEYE
jgi:hypothetical protein